MAFGIKFCDDCAKLQELRRDNIKLKAQLNEASRAFTTSPSEILEMRRMKRAINTHPELRKAVRAALDHDDATLESIFYRQAQPSVPPPRENPLPSHTEDTPHDHST